FAKVTRDVVKLLSEVTEFGQVYRVDLRLRPNGNQGPILMNLEETLNYYDVFGRTWERQAFVKARAIAGDVDLGQEFLAQMEPWIYRRYLSLADVTGIKALKRRIEHRAISDGHEERNVKTGRGGVRDVEFVIQFLQLLNGGDLPELRHGNTLNAIAQLEATRCLTDQERAILEDNYRFLRNVEHRLQFMFDLQTHLLPENPEEMRRVALRMGYRDEEEKTALQAFEDDYRAKTELNRRILDHLLHDAFPDDPDLEPEADLVLDPDPSEEKIQAVLGKYPFRDPRQTYRSLMSLAAEKIRWLSPRRCRLFLASIAPRLLKEIAAAPDPDQTLLDLEKVSESLGGKAVLWELFRSNPATLKLYVDVCASSPFLAQILVSNPGMIDELMDSLILNKASSPEELLAKLADLCRGAEDVEPILHSFKNSELLRIGVRDVLGKEPIEATAAALSDVAEVCLQPIVEKVRERLVEKFGEPRIEQGDRAGEISEFAVVAMGKFGGRELSYHSDLDVVFLYEADGHTAPSRPSRKAAATTNQHFFGELAGRLIKTVNRLGPQGRLYEVDARLRPTGRSGELVIPLDGFHQYFSEGEGELWERQALCKARAVWGSPRMKELVKQAIEKVAFEPPWRPECVDEVREMRTRLQDAAPRPNIKRGAGGIVDVEFLVQMLQLRFGGEDPSLRTTGT
ncbi:MAG: hypothetical protein N2C14_02605, partial [Planctomycetales bacterium]